MQYGYTQTRYGVEIYSDDGRDCFLQGEDASQLLDDLEKCRTDEQEQQILSEYDHIMEDSEPIKIND